MAVRPETSTLLDSNVLTHFLNGDRPEAATIVGNALRAGSRISIITWIEVMAGATPADEDATRTILGGFDCLSVDQSIAERAVALRRSFRLKLPDALIYATALETMATLVTFNSRDFKPGMASVLAL